MMVHLEGVECPNCMGFFLEADEVGEGLPVSNARCISCGFVVRQINIPLDRQSGQAQPPIKRGVVVRRVSSKGWIGAVIGTDGIRASVEWFKGRSGSTYVLNNDIAPITGYEFEAALALNDKEKVLAMYRGLQQELQQVRALIEDGDEVEDRWA